MYKRFADCSLGEQSQVEDTNQPNEGPEKETFHSLKKTG